MANSETILEIERLLRTGDVAAAHDKIEEILGADAEDGDALTFKARLLAFSGDVDAALGLLDRVLAKNDQHSAARGYKGAMLFDQGNHEGGQALLEEVVEADPTNASALFNLARCHGRKHETDQEDRCLSRAIELEPENAYFLYAKARVLSALGRHQESAGTLKRSLELHPANVEGWLVFAQMQQAGGAVDDSVANLREGIRHNPGSPPLRDALANTLLLLGDVDGALSEAESLCKDLPDNADLHLNLVVCYMAADRPAKVEETLRRALELDPDSARAHHMLASLLEATETPEGVSSAVEHLRRCIALAPDAWQPYNDLGLILMKHDAFLNLDEALGLLLKAEELAEGAPGPKVNLALAHARRGETDRAIELCDEVIQNAATNEQLKEMATKLRSELGG